MIRLKIGLGAVAAVFMLMAGAAVASINDVLIVAPESQQTIANEYIEIFDELGVNSTITNDLSLYFGTIDTLTTIFLIKYPIDSHPQMLERLAHFLDGGGNLYLYPVLFNWAEYDSIAWFFEQYLPIGWTTCDSWPFYTFSGVSGTFMSGYHFSFAEQHASSNMTPLTETVGAVLEDDVVCGCVAAATFQTAYKILATEFDLENTEDSGYPNNRLGMFQNFFDYFGIETTGIADENGTLPTEVGSLSNYPNPFNSRTQIKLNGGPIKVGASIQIYNLAGEKVREVNLSKEGTASWDGKYSDGFDAPSGIYFARCTIESSDYIQKMTLLK